jgi:uncharacterized protein YkwD
VAVAAPGDGILSTVRGGSYQSWSGTSMAGPHVAGLAGLVIAQNPARSNAQVRQVIQQSADDLGTPGRDDYFGYGRVNAERALGGELPMPTATPNATPRPTTTLLPTPRPPTPTGITTATPIRTATPDLGGMIGAMLECINRNRNDTGLPIVLIEAHLIQAAQRHSNDMAAHNFVDHVGTDGSTPWQRISQAGYTGSATGEIVQGTSSDTQVLAACQAFLDSPAHRGIILNPDSNEIGIGLAGCSRCDYAWYWTIDFGYRAGITPPPPPLTITPGPPTLTKTPGPPPTSTRWYWPTMTPQPGSALVIYAIPGTNAEWWRLWAWYALKETAIDRIENRVTIYRLTEAKREALLSVCEAWGLRCEVVP